MKFWPKLDRARGIQRTTHARGSGSASTPTISRHAHWSGDSPPLKPCGRGVKRLSATRDCRSESSDRYVSLLRGCVCGTLRTASQCTTLKASTSANKRQVWICADLLRRACWMLTVRPADGSISEARVCANIGLPSGAPDPSPRSWTCSQTTCPRGSSGFPSPKPPLEVRTRPVRTQPRAAHRTVIRCSRRSTEGTLPDHPSQLRGWRGTARGSATTRCRGRDNR